MTNITDIQTFDKMKNWQQQHEALTQKTLIELNAAQDQNGQNAIMENYYSQMEEIGYEFNFMEDKSSNDNTAYNERLLELGQGEVISRDTNGDGQVSFEEFIVSETADLNENDDKDTVVDTYTMATLLYEIIDKGLGNSDGSDSISAEEFASYYQNLDQFTLDENCNGYLTNQYDGKFDIDEAAEFIPFLINNLISQETYNELRELYAQEL